ncbi:MAG TPA: S53 family peptidase [Streptosporangiaceae bacterium]|nr:S53 family peptidase [Streptosporangiaceae bacterium]
MDRLHGQVRAGAIATVGLAVTAMAGAIGSPGALAAPAAGGPRFTAISGSLPPTTDAITGAYRSSLMPIEVSLAPRNPAGLTRMLRALYTRHSGTYQHWLARGQFDARFAPTAVTRAAVARYLSGQGLTVQRSSSPFLVRATGSSRRVSAAFRTTLSTYRSRGGAIYFANSAPVLMPAALATEVLGVIGLSDTVREHSQVRRFTGAIQQTAKAGPTASCEQPYPTRQQFFDFFNGVISGIPFGFGGGPGCSGLTPAQDNSIYGAPPASQRTRGRGFSIAVFELSAYLRSDIRTWARMFYGPRFTPPLADVSVDGGPLRPACPSGDSCPPNINGYDGDVEVNADIEMQLALSPDVRRLLVYNAPNDFTGQTELDEYTAIASADTAASVSSSWGVCENDAGAAFARAENTVFEQMAAQGQSMFAADGDTGAFGCLRSDGTAGVDVLDPASQPWVTSVGGTSLESANPGASRRPAYPAGVETVWNNHGLCNASPDEGGFPGFFWCTTTGAGGGGSSRFWGRPFYQRGPGVTSRFSTFGNGTTRCSLARIGTQCREDPDISANADEFTPYAEYCTATVSLPFAQCGFSASQSPPGWFGIGGTSLSSPLWSAIIADRDSFQGFRSGNVNPLLYLLDNIAPRFYFHDITGAGQTTRSNGLFPVTRGYDEATGIGTPKMARLITVTF